MMASQACLQGELDHKPNDHSDLSPEAFPTGEDRTQAGTLFREPKFKRSISLPCDSGKQPPSGVSTCGRFEVHIVRDPKQSPTKGNSPTKDEPPQGVNCRPRAGSPISISQGPVLLEGIHSPRGSPEDWRRPVGKRVEELRGVMRGSLLKTSPMSPRNGYRTPRRVSFLIEPALPEEFCEEDEEEEHESACPLEENDLEEIEDQIEEDTPPLPPLPHVSPDRVSTKARMEVIEEEYSPREGQEIRLRPRRFSYDSAVALRMPAGFGREASFMGGRGRPTVVTGGGGGGWRRPPTYHHHQPQSQHCLPPVPQQPTPTPQGAMGFTGCGDLGLATTACSSALLALQRLLPSPGGGSNFSSRPTSPGSFPSNSSGSNTPLEGEVGCSDLAGLYPHTEEAILHNLSVRYKRDQIYTYIGTELVSVNPYRRLAIYTPEIIHAYSNSSLFHLPPHIYALADTLHRGVFEGHTDQILVATGESGAGKTEAVKLVLQYIAAVTPGASCPVRQRLLQSNPVLEAFGNAKTKRNDNSSRFGKYLEVEFDFKGDPIGGTLSCYFLEKFRVTSHAAGERNFHIFYQLLAGADIQVLKSLKLHRNVENYDLLKSSRQYSVNDTLEDRSEFLITKRAFEAIGLSSDEQIEVLRVVAAVLKLGNVAFTPVNNIDGTEGCAVQNEYELHEVSDLLQCDLGNLTTALQTRTIETRREEVVVELSAAEAVVGRAALCRALYARLFSWVASRINDAIKVKTFGRRKVMGLLDMNGFEILDQNGFQQLVTNYCNEKLHQLLTTMTLKEKQEEYIREGLEWRHIEYATNYSTVEILEMSKSGILSIIDEVSTRTVESDSSLIDKEILHQFANLCGTHPNFEVKGARAHQHCDNNLPADAFRIRHYAGTVTYSGRGIAEKNSDAITKDISVAMFQSSHPILKAIFPEGNPRRASLRRPSSVVSQAQVSLGALLRTLGGKALHTVCCLKPNELKQPRVIEAALLTHQIKYFGLAEQSRLRSEGWVWSVLHSVFLERYKMISSHTWPHWGGAPLEGCAILLADLPITPAQYTFGRSKVFIKGERTVNELEQYRKEKLEDLATQVQRTWRAFSQRKRFKTMKAAQITIASAWRTWKAREEVREIKQKKKSEWAARIIQTAYLNYQRLRLLTTLLEEPPNESPISIDWPPSPVIVQDLSATLRMLHHKWRCSRYRMRFDQTSRNRMREKVTASLIFKDRKASYIRSIAHPFLGDYVRLRQNPQWKRIATESNDQFVVFADMVNKIARSSGKFVPILLAISTNSLLVLDQRTLQIKYRIPAADIVRVSLSPLLDDIAVIHVKPPTPTTELSEPQHLNPGCLFGSDEVKRKGDLVLQTCHIIEVVTKLFLVVQNASGKPPEIAICTEFEVNFGQNVILFTFRTGSLGEMAPGQIRIARRHNRMEVIL